MRGRWEGNVCLLVWKYMGNALGSVMTRMSGGYSSGFRREEGFFGGGGMVVVEGNGVEIKGREMGGGFWIDLV